MSFHDQLARKAVSMGKTAGDYTAASQKYAHAATALVVLAGTVWYLLDFSLAIVPFALAAHAAYQSITSTMIATRIEKFRQTGKSTPLTH